MSVDRGSVFFSFCRAVREFFSVFWPAVIVSFVAGWFMSVIFNKLDNEFEEFVIVVSSTLVVSFFVVVFGMFWVLEYRKIKGEGGL